MTQLAASWRKLAQTPPMRGSKQSPGSQNGRFNFCTPVPRVCGDQRSDTVADALDILRHDAGDTDTYRLIDRAYSLINPMR